MGDPNLLNITGASPEQEAMLREITAWPGVPDLARPITIVVTEGGGIFAGATGISLHSFVPDPSYIGYVFLHEYGHVWDRHWLSIEDRQEIIDLSGSPHSWYGGSYGERPAETFAATFGKITMASAGHFVNAAMAHTGVVYDNIAARIAESAAPFTDISDQSQEMQDAVNWLYNQGITKGMTATTYGPDEPVTRGQMALFLHRAFGS